MATPNPEPVKAPRRPHYDRCPIGRSASPGRMPLSSTGGTGGHFDHADRSPGRAAMTHPGEPHTGGLAGRLNWLRAGVLGANDGIVSTAGLVVGVAGATLASGPIMTAGVAGLVAGAVSMALGEYVSVSSQRDTERALLAKERTELAEFPDEEFDELTELYRAKGLSEATARQVA